MVTFTCISPSGDSTFLEPRAHSVLRWYPSLGFLLSDQRSVLFQTRPPWAGSGPGNSADPCDRPLESFPLLTKEGTHSSTPGFSTYALLTFWTRIFSVAGVVLCIIRCLAPSLASTHWMPAAPLPIMTIKSIFRYYHMSCWGSDHPWLKPTGLIQAW